MRLIQNCIITFCFTIFSPKLFGAPLNVEFWFISPGTGFFKKIDGPNIKGLFSSNYLTLNKEGILLDMEKCDPMGNGCFHPQLGFIEGSKGILKNNKKLNESEDIPKFFNSSDVDLVKCNKDYYFDIFCGKAKTENIGGDWAIWVDTSSSMRNVDYSLENEFCHRRNFIEKILRECPKGKISVSQFNTSIKTMSTVSELCKNYGNNNVKRLMEWIQNSSIKNLLIITDIDEVSLELKNFIDRLGAKVRGIESKIITGEKLQSLADSYIASCK